MSASSSRKSAPIALRNWPARAAAAVFIKGARMLFRLPPEKYVALSRRIESVIRFVNSKSGALTVLGDIRDIMENDPKGGEALRRIILESRYEQFRSVFAGMLKHHLKSGKAREVFSELRVTKRRRSGAEVRIGLIGDNLDLRMARHEYERAGNCRVVVPEGDAKALSLAGLDGVEIAHRSPDTLGLIEEALSRGVAVSAHHSLFQSGNEVRDLLHAADRAGAPLRIHYPYLFYPPVRRVKELLGSGEIGETTTLRVRATIGATGGTLTPAAPSGERYLEHEAFDHFLLLAYFGGRIETAAAYLNPMSRRHGGQGLVSCKFAHAGRYGLLEFAWAPDMYVWSDHYPYDLDAEIAGTDGIIWLRRGMAKRTHAAPVFVRVGRKAYGFGVETGFTDEWDAVYRNAASHFLEMIGGIEKRLMDGAAMASAFDAKNAAYRSAQNRAVVSVY